MGWRSPWTRLALVSVLGAAIAAGWASYGQYERSVRIQQEINLLKQEAERVARENETLSEKIRYFASPDFKEEEAKEKLGLRRQEEKVIAIDGDVRLEEDSLPSEGPEEEATKVMWTMPNYQKWWTRFAHPLAQ